jgi:hypothetical protein
MDQFTICFLGKIKPFQTLVNEKIRPMRIYLTSARELATKALAASTIAGSK